MKKIMLTTAIAATVFSLSTTAFADAGVEIPHDMEKCKVVDATGKGLIKEHRADGASAGTNKAGDPEAWIVVPAGECEKINRGDFTGVSDEVKDKIEGAH